LRFTSFVYIVFPMKNIRPIEAVLQTDRGQVRDHNEDFVFQQEPQTAAEAARNGWIFIVADGVGGADAGEIASQYATERALAHYLEANSDDFGQRLHNAMQAANADLRQLVAERNDRSRMATTMVTVVIHGQQATFANVGDSRGYHWRNGQLRQITKDQSLVAKLVEEGAITKEEALHHPRKNVILYSLGSEKKPQIDTYEQPLEPGDILVLCSDGLTRHVTDDEIAAIIAQEPPESAAQNLIQMANERGGQDNISAAVIHYNAPQTVVGQTERLEPAPMPAVAIPIKTSTTRTPGKPVFNRALLWFFTFLLSLVQTILIFLAWYLLRV